MIEKSKKIHDTNSKRLNLKNLKHKNVIGKNFRRKKILKGILISKIKNRSSNQNILNEISKDVEKVKLEPEYLILLEYISRNISNS